jgi:hypothetical protein
MNAPSRNRLDEEISFPQDPALLILTVEMITACIAGFFYRARPLPLGPLARLSAIHFAAWSFWVARAEWPDLINEFYPHLTGVLFVMTFLLSGVTSFVDLHNMSVPGERGARPWTWAMAGLSLTILILLWSPGWSFDVAHPRDPRSVRIELVRGPCQGFCPLYKLVIHGDGRVEYTGEAGVLVKGSRTTTVTTEQIARILDGLNRVRFFALEDRAFRWSFHSPSAGISLSIDGKSKRVVSDAAPYDAGPPEQEAFIQAAREIDAIVGTGRWTKCPRRCEQ